MRNYNLFTGLKNEMILVSYNTLIAIKKGDKIYLSSNWDYSSTTKKHVSKFLNISLDQVRGNISNNIYIMFDQDTPELLQYGINVKYSGLDLDSLLNELDQITNK